MNTRAVCLCTGLLLAFGSTELVAQIVLEATYPGTSARSLFMPTNSPTLDFNDDGIQDMAVSEADASTPKLQCAIVDGADPENRWTFFLPEPGDEIVVDVSRARVMGFYELDHTNDHKEIVIAEKWGRRYLNPIVVDADGRLLWSIKDGTSNTMFLTIDDMDGDGREEVVVFNPQVPQVEVWGELNGN